MRCELAAEDFETLRQVGYVERRLRGPLVKVWRSAIAGRAHAHGWRVHTGHTAGIAWAVLERDRVQPGQALHPPASWR